VDYVKQQAEHWRLLVDEEGESTIEGGPIEVTGGEPLERELTDFVLAVRDKRNPAVSGAEGRRALALAEQITKRITDYV
jgi:predicted dehydrogenase